MKLVQSPQNRFWSGKFGNGYLKRNPLSLEGLNKNYIKNYGLSRLEMNNQFLGKLDRNLRILEVGCNLGIQLAVLQKTGFRNLFGIDLNPKVVEFSKSKTKHLNVICAEASDIPFKDNYFDLVFTSGLLIHISPKYIKRVISEIYRCSRKYIWGFEYYAKKYTEIIYRGHKNVLWKADFAKLYLDNFKNLRKVKTKIFKYLDNDNEDMMFLLKKT